MNMRLTSNRFSRKVLRNTSASYPHDATLAQYYCYMARCLSVRHKPVLSLSGCTDRALYWHGCFHRPITRTLCYKEIPTCDKLATAVRQTKLTILATDDLGQFIILSIHLYAVHGSAGPSTKLTCANAERARYLTILRA